jgi:FPC/CPF motif-containing protein YcgG
VRRAASDPFAALEQAAAVAAFAPIQRGTHCVYAGGSVIWGARPLQEAQSGEANIGAVAADLTRFIDAAGELRLDAFVIELPGDWGATLARLAQTTHAVLRTLSEHDPLAEAVLDREIDDPSWCFAFGGDPLFVNTFAPCYPVAHSRYSFDVASTFVLLQPRHSFARVVRSGETVLPVTARHRIRRDYAAHERGYDHVISAMPFEARRIVRPLTPGDPPVRWWETPATFP